MKRIASIFMLAVFALNILGFYGVFLGVQAVQTELTSRKINEETFAGSETITFRIPLSLPYRSDDAEYQQAQGQFENNGEVYRLVKQKLLRDTLYIVCLKDADSKKINQDIADYVKTFSDTHDSQKQSNAKKILSPIKEYISSAITIKSNVRGWSLPIEYNTFVAKIVSSPDTEIIYPPRS